MENISELLKEAKPLYFKRKNRQLSMKILSAILLPAFLISGISTISYYNDVANLATLSSDSIISQMGLPTDEYGLLKID